MDNRCLICGDPIPEGRQVCGRCERAAEYGYGGRIFETHAKPPGKGFAALLRRIMQWLRRMR